jgi:hypothetical protein
MTDCEWNHKGRTAAALDKRVAVRVDEPGLTDPLMPTVLVEVLEAWDTVEWGLNAWSLGEVDN